MRTNDPIRVLVVDDELDLRELLQEALEDHGYAVTTAGNGAEALVQLRLARRRADVILLDLDMPVMDGASFRKALLSDPWLHATPVILLTAHARAITVANDLGDLPVLHKPVRLPQLLKVLDQIGLGVEREAAAG